ncbi:P-loop containing nucleoside triphosphate hydrolase protein [Flagelloscypha sp. PMI_526]|nr:P-loop containing nucleoside triphosphate hydrolase protein [Flagelloscypha sp. PMI_526]
MDDYDSLHPYTHASASSSRVRRETGVDCKIVVMGKCNSGVGKTSLLQRYTLNRFTFNTMSTSGALFSTKKVSLNGVKISMQLWDTAGQERFKSMAPMYYRGANAALLLYDITDSSSFNDVKGWLEELKKNSTPDLLIYIVGSKADLKNKRQVTPDLARTQLHNWFPRPPPLPVPPRPESKMSYIRPRFTSFPGLSSTPKVTVNASSNPPTPPGADSPSGSSTTSIAATTNKTSLDLMGSPTSSSTSYSSRPGSGLARSRTSSTRPRRTSAGPTVLTRSNTTAADGKGNKGHRHSMSIPNLPKGVGSKIWGGGDGWIWGSSTPAAEEGSDSIEEEDEDGLGRMHDNEGEWGLERGMELFEVSAKDDMGIQHLFDHLLGSILERLDKIEAENEKKRRDSVFLGSSSDLPGVARPGWSAQADEEERRLREEEERAARRSSWTRGACCT